MEDATGKVIDFVNDKIDGLTDKKSLFALVPLNVTLQAALGENQMMSLVMSVHPGIEDDAAVNARIDRMVALLERQKQRALIPVLESQLKERQEIRKKVLLTAQRIDAQFAEEDGARVSRLHAVEQEYERAFANQSQAWEENDGRRPFDPRNAKVAKVIGPLAESAAKLRSEIETKRREIDQHRLDHQGNIAETDAKIAELEDRLASIRSIP
jgi:hypothetical protein